MKNKNCKIVFMGTPDFAVPTLDEILKAGYDVIAVVTAPDKYGGRGKKQLIESSVKKFALSKGLTILQPTNLKDPSFVKSLEEMNPDIQIVVAFRMLPKQIWRIPRNGTFNLHASLLPAYRGAAPINWAIIKGEKETGVTTFLIDDKIDTGAILLQKRINIEEADTAGTLHDKLMNIGAELVIKTIEGLENKTIKPIKQNSSKSSEAPKIFRNDGKIDFNQKTIDVYNFIRGLSPYPGAWAHINDVDIKIFEGKIHLQVTTKKAGIIETDQQSYLKISTTDGFYEVLELQISGRKRMKILEFIRGNNLQNILK